MKNFKNLLLVVVVLVASLIITACGGKKEEAKEVSVIDQIKSRGTIKIGVFGDKPPFGSVDSNGKNVGFDVFIGKRFGKELLGDENKVEFVLVEAANRVEYLETNKVDIILANFTVTPARAERVDFANPYMKVALGVVSPEGAVIKSVEDLKGKKLIVNKGTTAEIYFTKNHPEIELLSYDQNSEAFAALKDGRGAALAHDNLLVFAWASQNKGFVTGIEALGNQDTIAPAVKKGNKELLDWINNTLADLGKEQFINKAFEAELKPVYGDSVSAESVVVEGGQL